MVLLKHKSQFSCLFKEIVLLTNTGKGSTHVEISYYFGNKKHSCILVNMQKTPKLGKSSKPWCNIHIWCSYIKGDLEL